MNTKAYNVLIVEKDAADLSFIRTCLHESLKHAYIENVEHFADVRTILTDSKNKFDVILLDLNLPDISPEELVPAILAIADCPVIILTGHEDLNFSISTISAGIYDYLLKSELSPELLCKSILYSIERKKNIDAQKSLTKQYRDLFKFSPQPMWVFNAKTLQFFDVNKAALDLFGYTKEEFLAYNVREFIAPEFESPDSLFARYADPLFRINKLRCLLSKKNGEVLEAEIYNNPLYINEELFRFTIAFDVTEKNRIDQKITRAIIKAQEDERRDIGGELHDNVCQLLATSLLGMGMIKQDVPPEELPFFNQGKTYVQMALEEIRRLSHRLMPAFLDHTTLEQAFKKAISAFNVEEKYKIKLLFDTAVNSCNVSNEIQLNIYRILQEQLRNILKYAQATAIRIEVALKQKDLIMRISDNGVGFDMNTTAEGIGLTNIRRRAEIFNGRSITLSAAGKGCKVKVIIPVPNTIRSVPDESIVKTRRLVESEISS